MADHGSELLVLRDVSGAFYLLPREVLDAARVPAELQAELEQLVSSDDTAGHVLPMSGFASGVAGEASLEYLIGHAAALQSGDARQDLASMAQRLAALKGRRPSVMTWPP